jgi:hypothetical protein
MKILIGFLVIIAIINCLPLTCKVCIESAELLQKTLIKLTPEFVAKDVVKSVCERQCMISIIKTNQNNYVKWSQKSLHLLPLIQELEDF